MTDILLANVFQYLFGMPEDSYCFGIHLLKGCLEDRGFKAQILEGYPPEYLEYIEKHQSEVRSVGFYCTFENEFLVGELSRYVKEHYNLPVIIGGPQTIGFEEAFFKKSLCDCACAGEGEETLTALMEHYFGDKRPLEDIKGICYLDANGKLVHTQAQKVIMDLDLLPWPKLGGKDIQVPMTAILTGRGCPYQCAFCFEGANAKHIRFHSVDVIMGELEKRFEVNPGMKLLLFNDDTFTLSRDRVFEICERLKILREKYDFVWTCYAHVQTISKWPDMISKMLDAGMVKIFLGIESGCEDVLKLYRKGTTSDMIKEVVADMADRGVCYIAGNIIVGGPVESRRTIDGSLQFCMDLLHKAPGIMEFSTAFLIPFPQTNIAKKPEEYGLRIKEDLLRCRYIGDIPATESDEMDTCDLMRERLYILKSIRKEMHDMHLSGQIPMRTIMEQYHLEQKYGIFSQWISFVYRRHKAANLHYMLLNSGNFFMGERFGEDLCDAVPHRLVPPNITENGQIYAYNQILSKLEYDLLIECAGRLCLREILERLYFTYGNSFVNKELFNYRAIQLLNRMEQRHLITYSRF